MQTTFAIIKPDATRRDLVGAIIDMAEKAGLSVVGLRMTTLTREQAEAIYAEHAGRHYFVAQVDYMTSGPVVAALLEGEDAIAKWRAVMGPTDREKAPEGTVRNRYALSLRENCVHGSDTHEAYLAESAILFGNA